MCLYGSFLSKLYLGNFHVSKLPVVLWLLFSVHTYSQEEASTISLFDGTTLEGWHTVKEENSKYWSVRDSSIVGGDGKQLIPENTFLYTADTYEDFELRCLFRLTGDPASGFINSGIQYRSFIEGDLMIGYQADIGDGFWGGIYDEHRRGELMIGDLSILRHLLHRNGWNSYIIRVKGNTHELYINGVKTAAYVEEDASIPSRGLIALQLHSGGKAQIEVRDISITRL